MRKGKPLAYFVSKLFRRKIPYTFGSGETHNDVNWKPIYAAQELSRTKPINYGAKEVEFDSYPITKVPELGVYRIKEGLLNCSNGWVFTGDKQTFLGTTWYSGFANEVQKNTTSIPVFPQKVRGRVLSLLSDFAINNYGHLLLDALGRYQLFLKAGFSEKDIDYVIVPGRPNDRTAEWAKQMGIPTSKLLWSRQFDFLKADEIVLTSFPGVRRSYLPVTVEFLQQKLGNYEKASGRRLYIQRMGRRKVSNEQDILPILEEFGFEIYRPELSSNSIEDFCQAEAVLAGHGAGLTDIAFCRKGTPVLELIPSDHIYEYFYTLADAAFLKYGYLLCQSEHEREPGSFGPSFSDYYVDPQLLREAMQKHFGNL